MDATTRAAMILAGVTAVVVLTLALLHRFTDLPLWPRRRRPAERPVVDWSSAPDLPAYDYAVLYELAARRRDALGRAVRCAREAGLPLPEDGLDTAFERRTGQPYDRRAEEGVDLADVAAVLEVTRIGMRSLACLTQGSTLVLDPPCYFNPLHERGTERIPYPPDAFSAPDPEGHDGDQGEDEEDHGVAACAACAAGPAEPLLVWTREGTFPYYRMESGTKAVYQTSGYGAAVPEWDADDLLTAFVEWHVFDQYDENGALKENAS
ncbi:hypothetical protein [Streptomyces indicus]|nr:hypothetical protein [Streptomyces indicus]